MRKNFVLLLVTVVMVIISACNPIKKADNLLQDAGQRIAETCTAENSWADSCNNLP